MTEDRKKLIKKIASIHGKYVAISIAILICGIVALQFLVTIVYAFFSAFIPLGSSPEFVDSSILIILIIVAFLYLLSFLFVKKGLKYDFLTKFEIFGLGSLPIHIVSTFIGILYILLNPQFSDNKEEMDRYDNCIEENEQLINDNWDLKNKNKILKRKNDSLISSISTLDPSNEEDLDVKKESANIDDKEVDPKFTFTSEELALATPDIVQHISVMDGSRLSEIVDKCKNLKMITGSYEAMDTIGEVFGTLPKLIYLDIHANALFMSPAITKLKMLEHLDIADNRLSILPEEIGDLKNLNFLALVGNKLTTLPKSIEKLDNLTHLHIGGNPFENLSECIMYISNLKSLEYLSIRGWGAEIKLTELPSNISLLNNKIKTLSVLGQDFSEEEKERIKNALPNVQVDID